MLRTQVPAPHLAILIQRHQRAFGGESRVDEGLAVARENHGASSQQVLVVIPFEAE